MKRRSFLAMLGLAPVAVATSAPASMAQSVEERARQAVIDTYEFAKQDWRKEVCSIDFDVMEKDIHGHLEWLKESLRLTTARLDRLDIAMADEWP